MSNINVNVSGTGQLNIGNLAQGQEVNINSGDMSLVENTTTLVKELLQGVRNAAGGDNSRVEAVQGKVQELGEALTAEPRNTGKVKEILGMIKQHHDWAFPAIATMASIMASATPVPTVPGTSTAAPSRKGRCST